MWNSRRSLVVLAVIVVLVAAAVAVWPFLRNLGQTPGCTVTAILGVPSDTPVTYTLSAEQADNAATIAAVGLQLGMPDHAVTVALAAALQESGLRNLPDGDRDSAGLFQQRPSQGWGTREQILDPIYAASAFYQELRDRPEWAQLSVADAAQLVQRSAAPSAYAQWEPWARAGAAALTGEVPAALTCRGLRTSSPSADLVATATAELGTAVLSGMHTEARGWSIGSWLVAHSSRLGIDWVTFDGRTWTMTSGRWSQTGPADQILSLHQARTAA